MGGIYGGIFTPTEAAAVSAVYAFICAVFIYKNLKLKEVPKVLLHAANTSAMLPYIITNAILFNFLLTSEQIPQNLAAWITEQNMSAWQFLVIVNLTLLLAGQFMEPSSIILILAPLFLPIAQHLGIDPIHLGIIMTVNMEIGMIPPTAGAEPLRGQPPLPARPHRGVQGGAALRRRDAGLPGPHHLCAGDFPGPGGPALRHAGRNTIPGHGRGVRLTAAQASPPMRSRAGAWPSIALPAMATVCGLRHRPLWQPRAGLPKRLASGLMGPP